MAESQGQLICRLCQLRDELKKTPQGRLALMDVVTALVWSMRDGASFEQEMQRVNALGQKGDKA